MSRITDALDKAKQVKPIAEKNGIKIVATQDAKDAMAGELLDPTDDLGVRTLNQDGSIARSRTVISQISTYRIYDNRFKRQGTKGVGYDEVWVVPAIDPKGYRAVVLGMEDRNIPVYKITKSKDEQHDFILAGKTTVDYQKFHSEFTHKLSEESMKKIIPLFALENDEITNDDIEEMFK